MITKKNVFYVFLILIVVLIYYFYQEKNNKSLSTVNLEELPIYQSGASSSYFYNISGALDYLVVASGAKHYEFDNSSFFSDPEITFFNIKKEASWNITSEEAKILNNKLYLYENVDIKSLLSDSKLKQILTTNVTIELDKKIATSDDFVTMYGSNLKSTGIGMIASLPNKKADILNDVKSSYFTPSSEKNKEIAK